MGSFSACSAVHLQFLDLKFQISGRLTQRHKGTKRIGYKQNRKKRVLFLPLRVFVSLCLCVSLPWFLLRCISNIEQRISNDEVGKPSNLELAIEIAEYGTRAKGELTPTSSILPAALLLLLYRKRYLELLCCTGTELGLERFFTSLLDIPCSILDIQSHSCAVPEVRNLPLIGYSCLSAIMRSAKKQEPDCSDSCCEFNGVQSGCLAQCPCPAPAFAPEAVSSGMRIP